MTVWVLSFSGMVQNREEECQIGPQGFKVVRKSFNFVSKDIKQKGRVSNTSRRISKISIRVSSREVS